MVGVLRSTPLLLAVMEPPLGGAHLSCAQSVSRRRRGDDRRHGGRTSFRSTRCRQIVRPRPMMSRTPARSPMTSRSRTCRPRADARFGHRARPAGFAYLCGVGVTGPDGSHPRMNAASTDASRSLDGPSQNRWFGESSSTSSAPGMVSARFWACEKRTPASKWDPVTSVGHATRVSAAHRSSSPLVVLGEDR
jgi:hypothetical protein